MRDLTFDHIHIHAHDLDAAEAFFRSQLDAELALRYRTGMSDSRALLLGGVRINLAATGPAGSPYSRDHFGIRVPDVDVAVRGFAAAGARVLSEPHDWSPTTLMEDTGQLRSDGRFAFIEAPGGILIELVDRR